ncbi:MAG: transposase [Candidatus Zambryskibacteria bacterium]|nr:transposase [Candidatus Zambryskibacteria bacterium]
MSIRAVNFVPGEFYHIYNRGNSKNLIFHDNDDYNRFLKLLYTANATKNLVIRNFSKIVYQIEKGERLVSIGAYCLMPNHFHILITQTRNGDITKFMHKLCTSYSMYYNNKYKRTGKLFEGKFKSEYADNDQYLKYLFSYIHLNPLKIINPDWKSKGVRNHDADFLANYKFSSYIDYLEKERDDKVILNKDDFPNYFPTKESFKTEIADWLRFV